MNVPCLRAKGWAKWQKLERVDRGAPKWIKLHRSLLDDPGFFALDELLQRDLILIWLHAAASGGCIPNDPELVAMKILTRRSIDLEALINAGFLIPDEKQDQGGDQSGPTLDQSGNQPGPELDQNRSKAGPEPVQSGNQPGPEPAAQEVEEDIDKIKIKRVCTKSMISHATSPTTSPQKTRIKRNYTDFPGFVAFWLIYPRGERKPAAFRVWVRDKLEQQVDQICDNVRQRLAEEEAWQERDAHGRAKFAPHAATFLNQTCWMDDFVRSTVNAMSDKALERRWQALPYVERERFMSRFWPEELKHREQQCRTRGHPYTAAELGQRQGDPDPATWAEGEDSRASGRVFEAEVSDTMENGPH